MDHRGDSKRIQVGPVDLGKPAVHKIVNGLLFTPGHVGGKALLSAHCRRSRLPHQLDSLVYHGPASQTYWYAREQKRARARVHMNETPLSCSCIAH